ncbi:MAG: hypothetical protein GXZ08_02905 [Tissierellia bacterium]|nr:hypothetical protein [Tissierellia bacterium]
MKYLMLSNYKVGENQEGANGETYILPNASLLRRKTIEFADRKGGVLNNQIISFDDLVGLIIGKDIKKIDTFQKNILLRRAYNELLNEGKLSYYAHMGDKDGFFLQVEQIITEFKRNILSVDQLFSVSGPESIEEIKLIYERYESFLSTYKLNDREDEYIICIDILKEKEYTFPFESVIISDFLEFRRIEMELIKSMADSGVKILVKLPYDVDRRNTIIEKTKADLSFLNTVDKRFDDESTIFNELAKTTLCETEVQTDDIKFIRGKTKYFEVKKIFEFIKAENEECPLENISIVVSSNDYLDIISKVAIEEGIKLNVYYNSNFKNSPIIRELLGILAILETGGERKDVINYIKNYYFCDLEIEDKHSLEKALRPLEFNSLSELKSIFDTGEDLCFDMEYYDDVKQLISRIESLLNRFSENEFVEELGKYYEEFKVLKKILDDNQKDYDEKILKRDIHSHKLIEESIGKLRDSKEVLELETNELIELLSQYLNTSEYKSSRTEGGVNVYSFINALGLKDDIRFLCGMNSSYPSVEEDNFILNSRNWDMLLKQGIDIKSKEEIFDNEILKFCNAVSNTNKKLYISFTSEDQENKTESSILVRDIADRLKIEDLGSVLVENTNRIKSNYDEITTIKDLKLKILYDKDVLNSAEYINYVKALDKEYFDIINELVSTEIERFKGDNPFAGVVKNSENIEYIINLFKDYKYSANSLQTYYDCPFLFYMKYVMNIEKMDRQYEDQFYRNRGNILHEILQIFYKKNSLELNRFHDNLELLTDEINMIADAISSKYDIDTSKNEGRVYLDVINYSVIGLINEDLNRLADMDFKFLPKYYEEEFYYKSKLNSDFNILGRIDRIDSNGEANIIIDYKTSSSPTSSSVMRGEVLQMPIYSLGIGKETVAAAIYEEIRTRKINHAFMNTKYYSGNSKNKLDSEGLIDFLDSIEQDLLGIYESILNGDYRVRPKKCNEHCPFKDVCRYDEKEVGEDEL